MKITLGSLAVFFISGFVYQQSHWTPAMTIGGGAFVVFLLSLLVAMVYHAIPTEGSRRKARANLERMEKEMGHRPYTGAELREIEAEERATHNKNAAEAAVWGDDRTYIDYDGVIRKVGSNEVVGFAYRRKKG